MNNTNRINLNSQSLQAAAQAAAQINAQLAAEGKIQQQQNYQPSNAQKKDKKSKAGRKDLFNAEVEINGLPPRVRNLLTKGYIQEQIQWKSSNYNIWFLIQIYVDWFLFVHHCRSCTVYQRTLCFSTRKRHITRWETPVYMYSSSWQTSSRRSYSSDPWIHKWALGIQSNTTCNFNSRPKSSSSSSSVSYKRQSLH